MRYCDFEWLYTNQQHQIYDFPNSEEQEEDIVEQIENEPEIIVIV